MSWFSKLKSGLSKTSQKISTGIDEIFNKRNLDEETAEELEELLISADLGVETSAYFVKNLKEKFRFNKDASIEDIKKTLVDQIVMVLEPLAVPEINFSSSPHIMLMCGVNGNGKTTSIAKLANYFIRKDKKVILGACDTFRAAAVEQLNIWAKKLNIEIITGTENADPASVAYKTVKTAIDKNYDLALIDTAGRLHNKENLMAELAKIVKVTENIDQNIKPQIILVLDATTGQNALSQIDKFSSVAKIDGLIITKLDGTAKGGIVVAIARKYQIPIISIGVGEAIDDLRPFSAKSFAENLVDA